MHRNLPKRWLSRVKDLSIRLSFVQIRLLLLTYFLLFWVSFLVPKSATTSRRPHYRSRPTADYVEYLITEFKKIWHFLERKSWRRKHMAGIRTTGNFFYGLINGLYLEIILVVYFLTKILKNILVTQNCKLFLKNWNSATCQKFLTLFSQNFGNFCLVAEISFVEKFLVFWEIFYIFGHFSKGVTFWRFVSLPDEKFFYGKIKILWQKFCDK